MKNILKLNNNKKKLLITNYLSTYSTIDCHTHMYTPKYMKILKSRNQIPKVINVNGSDRLVILPNEDKEITEVVGRAIGKEYWDVESKLLFMDNYKIDKSIVSLANPWLDFIDGNKAQAICEELNDELQNISELSNGRIYGFATLPMRSPAVAINEIKRLKSLNRIKGVILGTPGAGKGLDHPEVFEVLQAIADNDLLVFLHPHYGVGNEHYHDSGHALFLSLGFPFETTVSVARLIVSGTLDKIPNLKILVAHAGAALPSLIGRIDSCVQHDTVISNRLLKAPSEYFKSMYFDAISYNPISLNSLIQLVGKERIFFGTDNPFFPPPNATSSEILNGQWVSTNKIYESIKLLNDPIVEKNILYDNITQLLKL